MNRYVPARLLVGAMLIQALAACEYRCESAAVSGTFVGMTNGVELEMTLTPDGRGTVKSSANVSGPLTWKLIDVESQQLIELEGEGLAISALAAMEPKASPLRTGSSEMRQTYGPVPECGRSGRMESLVFSFDDGIELRRKH